MSALERMTAYRAETHTARTEDAAAQVPVMRLPSYNTLVAYIHALREHNAALEARLEALESWNARLNASRRAGSNASHVEA